VTVDLLHRMAYTLTAGLARSADVPADDEELYRWVADHVGLRILRRACCPDHRARRPTITGPSQRLVNHTIHLVGRQLIREARTQLPASSVAQVACVGIHLDVR
jgi:hypothetical protein